MNLTEATYLGLRVGEHVLGPIPPAQRPVFDACRCVDPQTVIVSTGPVLCRSCGRRMGGGS